MVVLADIIEAIRDFHKWTAPQYVAKGMANMMDDCYMKPDLLGVGLIIGAWNYPFHLVMLPLVGAIAAGNAIIVKPSELSINTSNLVYDLIPKYLDNDFYAVVTGGADVAQCLLKERFDHIFYTGSTHVGKIVMKAAAEHLTPVMLELGGKSPVIVADDANIEVAARRIMWGKLTNAGQICIAPDYVLCSESIRDRFVDSCKKAAEQFYGKDPSKSPDYACIINTRHFKRITGLMEATKATCVSKVVTDEDQRYISPALYVGVTEDDPLMKEEIFGPLLPVLTVSSIDEAVQFTMRERSRCLSMYSPKTARLFITYQVALAAALLFKILSSFKLELILFHLAVSVTVV
ncbi:PREDICTED: fatty aldehyde dehydrogenase-like [Amphimedon queenslandica]|uniref:Aldehyde dehydrogenase domain-containing protein n=1 Tax=Amphimedon queenslandica TaxID=400682 RepID=A0A1X7UBQ8_AMPQE|nr:PREDICTED: fatty aldehyde dehydrogenase-like [Amphimedon queenslandica]|eukprot:XP_019855106.1 PREDICTED: fatty aldehyde dehydrogenase-like [Amphimedon queenslandica]